MDKAEIKLELTKLIGDIENPELIEKIKSILTEEKGDFWESLTEEQKQEMKKKNQ
ncbi:MAG: hypothetical protein JXQ96_18725 [Cyclobacteriaceae bacterium]